MIVGAVEADQLLVGEIGNGFWVAAGIVVVGGGGEEVFGEGLPQL